MRKLVYIFAAALCLTAGAAATTGVASAQSVGVTIGVGDGDRDRDWRGHRWRGYHARAEDRVIIRSAPRCRTITIRTRQADGDVIIRKQRRCS